MKFERGNVLATSRFRNMHACKPILMLRLKLSYTAGLVPFPVQVCYAATKHGVVGFSRSMLMKAHTDSVRINCICPSFVNSKMLTEKLASVEEAMQQFVLSAGPLECVWVF